MGIPLDKIAELVEGEIKGDSQKVIRGVAPFDDAVQDQITLAGQAKFLKKLNETRAGAVIVSKGVEGAANNLVVVKNPQVAFAKIINIFNPLSKAEPGISPGAYVGENFIYGSDLSIAPTVVIQDNVTLGNRVTLHPGVVIGNDAVIENDVEIYPNVTIYPNCRIGSRVRIHAGSVIGSDGFGYAHDGHSYHKIPHTGIVQIDDDVEIGAANTIDRGTFGKTWIQKGVKTDNLVQIAHNVTVGENTVLVAQVGISGSTTIGKYAILAGQAGIAGHLTIGDHATIGPQAGICKSVPDREVVSGTPEMPHRLWLRAHKIFQKLPELYKKISNIEKRLTKIEEK